MMRKKLFLFGMGAVAFILFVLFSYLVHKNLFSHLDFDMTVRFQDNLSRRLDPVFSFFSAVGSFEPVTIFLLILLVIHRKLRGIVVLGLFGFIHVLELYGKIFVGHLPPPEFMIRTQRLVEFPQFHVRTENSYPSGHMARAAFITVVLMLLFGRSGKLGKVGMMSLFALLLAYDIVMFGSRVYLGEHWFSDVVGGGILGTALGLISILFI